MDGANREVGEMSDRERILCALAGGVVRRQSELTGTGVRDVAISRMADRGEIVRLGWGLYQLPDAEVDRHQTLLEAALRVPRGVICLTSALRFHELTDVLPATVWMAIYRKDRKPRIDYPAISFVRSSSARLQEGVETHQVAGGEIRLSDPVRTLVDLFRRRDKTGLAVAIEGLKNGLEQGRVMPTAVAEAARAARAWNVMRPYVEALAHG
jgi:predicted transcriptional regulator of viral defense system